MATISNSHGCSQLPLELWDRIIDFVAGNLGGSSERRDIVACSLVCWAFVNRCRFHLIHKLTIRSRAQLDQVIRILSNSPIFCARLSWLIIDAGNGADQSWVSTVPFRLPLSVSRLENLTVRGVDLRALHPQALQAFSRIRIDKVYLEDVRYSSYTQLTRFFSIATEVRVFKQPAMTHEVAALRRLPPSPRQGERSFYVYGLLWATLCSMTQSLDLSTCTGEWRIHFRIDMSGSEETSGMALANIRRGFDQICEQPERVLSFRILLQLGGCWVKVKRYSHLLI